MNTERVGKKMRLKVRLGSILVLLPILAYGALSEQPQARVQRLERSVLAPCCYTESVAIHQSEIALKMRMEIERWVGQGNTDEQILGAYTTQYGAKILVDPATLPKEWSYLVPWTVVVLGAAVAAWTVRRWHVARPAALALSAGVPGTVLPPVPGFDDE